ncbi:unnamed protein product [Phytophthora fragariaefolia]|uniref:Unnamed protein product n=1 Tax=Phytophthora fragariaefolia TaxID=1490495 RepID=A0A9W6XN17_9STRA|nr:unnamed protein product [Phytophthora fragariaefolia]
MHEGLRPEIKKGLRPGLMIDWSPRSSTSTHARGPVMKDMRPRPIGELQGQLIAPGEAFDMLYAVMIVMCMLIGAGIVLGSFDANELFDMEQSAIKDTSLSIFVRLATIVGNVVPVP